MVDSISWAGTGSTLSRFVAAETESALNSYRARPDLIREHSNIEAAISQGGYGRKQLNELIQNAADAIAIPGGRIRVVLTQEALYCANEGEPFTEAGFRTLMLSHSSEKRDDQIGRFGLGFKSVIQVTDEPSIISRHGSVSWSQEASRALLQDLYPGLDAYPILRLATPIDPAVEAASDPILAELMEWAATVVKLPFRGSGSWLSKELRDFPHAFLLFSEKIGALEFDDRLEGSTFSWSAERAGNRITLNGATGSEEWLLFRHKHQVSTAAAVEAGSIVARTHVDVSWAVPMTSKQRNNLGQFWNYFPTRHETSLRGIVNAAFKMNEDRHSLLETRYNEEILTKAIPLMVAGALPHLSTHKDPSAFLDILPSRDRESESWADKTINGPIFKMLPSVPCLPDRSGTLRTPLEVQVQPELKEATRLVALWDSFVGPGRPWLHTSAFGRKRESQVVRILTEASVKRASVEQWLEEVAYGGTLQDFENALQLAAMIDKSHDEHRAAMRRSHIVLMADGRVQPPITSRVHLPLDANDESENLVSYELLHHGNANVYLRALDLQAQDGRGRISRVATQVAEDYANADLAESLWRLTRSLPIPEALSVVTARTEPLSVLVRCKDAAWRRLADVWLPGSLLPSDSSSDAHLIVDDRFHGHDLALFRNLGARTGLAEARMIRSGGTYTAWKRSVAGKIVEDLSDSPTPVAEAGLKFTQALTTDGLDLLASASRKTRVKITQLLLKRPQYPTTVEFTSNYLQPIRAEGPDMWWIRTHGVLETPLGLVPVKDCVGAIPGIPEGFLPYPGEDAADRLSLPDSIVAANWPAILTAAEEHLKAPAVHELYGALALNGVKAPKEILIKTSNGQQNRYPRKHVAVCADDRTLNHLMKSSGIPALFTGHPDLDQALADNWNLEKREITFVQRVVPVPSDIQEPATLKTLFPYIARATSGLRVSTLCVPCSKIEEIETNSHDKEVAATQRDFHLDAGTLYYMEASTDLSRLAAILRAFGNNKKPADVMAIMREHKKADDAEKRKRRVREQKTDAGKVAELVGRQTLRALIPAAVADMLAARDLALTDQRLFDIVSNLHGTSLLKVLKPALQEAGVETPDYFRGGRTAQEFVKELGFSPGMAGETLKRKPEREEVVGPVRFNTLHEYQESTSRKIRDLLSGSATSKRGLVQLPTGAGKTRVAVESVVRGIADTPTKKLVVWIAQSEELCEQALETWTYVWQAVGPAGERMAVSRLWGGNSAVQEETKLHLVVATIQTLSSIQQNRRQIYNWLSNPDLVIVDEAHGATAASYTPVLSWFGRSFTDKSRLLLGLSATPYRGSNEKETERLVARFGGNLIEPDEFTSSNAHEYLQRLRVLANVRHEELEGIDLKLKDMRSAKDADTPNAMLEARIDLQQVAESTQRNEAILDHIKNSESKGPTLVFAASVEHAEALAAVLTVEGIPAASISGKTDLSHRRAVIEDFRQGKIRVLTNFDVLTQGFDAPKVDAVYVCRPTFSPNKYIQMIGRGLRGPANGGSEEVLIVNVKDNLDQYGEQLAFTQFDHLWHREAAHAE